MCQIPTSRLPQDGRNALQKMRRSQTPRNAIKGTCFCFTKGFAWICIRCPLFLSCYIDDKEPVWQRLLIYCRNRVQCHRWTPNTNHCQCFPFNRSKSEFCLACERATFERYFPSRWAADRSDDLLCAVHLHEPETDAFLWPISSEVCDTFAVEYLDTLGDFVPYSSIGLFKNL